MSPDAGTPVYFVVPEAIDDPDRVSGGNVYDQHVRAGLQGIGWEVRTVLIPDDGAAPTGSILSGLPDGALLLVDGLIAVRESDALVAHSSRLLIVVLAHMVASLHDRDVAWQVDREREVLHAARRIIATSEWTRSELIARDLAEPHTVVVARPGTDAAAMAVASESGGRLLCVGVVAPHKGQDLLVRALAGLSDIDGWTCTFVGSRDTAPDFALELAQSITQAGLSARITFAEVLAGSSLESAYAGADLIVVPSRSESFGMVVAEALARGIPVVATRVGGIPEAISDNPAGVTVPPEDPWALEVVLRQWLSSPARRTELKAAAVDAAQTVVSWSATTAAVAAALDSVAQSGSAISA